MNTKKSDEKNEPDENTPAENTPENTPENAPENAPAPASETEKPVVEKIDAASRDTRDEDARDESEPNAKNTPIERRPEDIAREPDGSPTKRIADNRRTLSKEEKKAVDKGQAEPVAQRPVTEQLEPTDKLRETNAARDPEYAASGSHESTDADNLKSGRYRETTYPMKDVTGPPPLNGTKRMPVEKIDRDKVRPDPSLFIETAPNMTQEGQNDTRDGNIPAIELSDLKARARRLAIPFDEDVGVEALREKMKAWSAERHAQPKTRASDSPFVDASEKPMGDADYDSEEEAARHKGHVAGYVASLPVDDPERENAESTA